MLEGSNWEEKTKYINIEKLSFDYNLVHYREIDSV